MGVRILERVRLAAVALNQTPLDWDNNAERIREGLQRAREGGAAVVCLPELCITGYGCEDAFFSTDVVRRAADALHNLLPSTAGCIAALGLPVGYLGQLYNAVALAVDTQLVGVVAKQHLAGDGIHYEPRWFHPWPPDTQAEIEIAGQRCPFGDIVFDCGGLRIGFEICRDAWVADRPAPRLAARGADVILNPSASHFAFGKQDIRRGFSTQASGNHGVAFVYANLLGNEAGRAIYDGGTLIADRGEIVASGPRFSFDQVALLLADVNVAANRRQRTVPPKVAAGNSPGSAGTVVCEFAMQPPPDPPAGAVADDQHSLKEEEFTRAVCLGLYDYLRKSRGHGFVVSLSGGADSSAVATLVYLMIRFATSQLGRERFVASLDYISDIADCVDESALVHRLLTCVYQATEHSSDTTLNAAKTVSAALGAEFVHWNVDEQVAGYVDMVATAIGRNLNWETDDVALQNVQARARGPGIWLLANLRSALLLATSNRSEAAVGYATMDGDTCGGLAPIAGIDKAFLRQWLAWMETKGPASVGCLPALAVVNAQQPTAELRPPSARQTDEDDLMPYVVLDAIERAAIRDHLAPVEVWEMVAETHPEYDRGEVGHWVERFFTLWCRNQWKRERYAPSFHLDDENLDPKTWCRFPILSGGYRRELDDLRAALRAESGTGN